LGAAVAGRRRRAGGALTRAEEGRGLEAHALAEDEDREQQRGLRGQEAEDPSLLRAASGGVGGVGGAAAKRAAAATIAAAARRTVQSTACANALRSSRREAVALAGWNLRLNSPTTSE
jgi:hypothetical protein